jgi:lipopolysaccharide transport system ATP-binding protein
MPAECYPLPSELAIRVADLSKRYEIGRRARVHDTLREQMTAKVRSFFKTPFGRPANTHMALQDVSFDLPRGQVVGIIGGNGAGKSTLLKILARVTAPSAGVAHIRGRVGALLEVGSGFHPELTGRENVFLNGAILGMKRSEMVRKFDQIVDFAEIHSFIDTPVKRYSSGMYVRLAFAVAAHLEPDILIVDEALAVGDFAFQRKCLGQLQTQAGSGRTVLFVSHNLGAIRLLCQRCLLLQSGRLVLDGPAESVIERYLQQVGDHNAANRSGPRQPDVGEGFLFHAGATGGDLTIFCGEPLVLDFDIESLQPPIDTTVGIGIKITSPAGDPIISMDSVVQRAGYIKGQSRRWRVRCDLGRVPLNAGTYFVQATACVYVDHTVKRYAQFSNALAVHVLEHDVFGWGTSLPRSKYWGPMYWAPRWEIRPTARLEGAAPTAARIPTEVAETVACQDYSGS